MLSGCSPCSKQVYKSKNIHGGILYYIEHRIPTFGPQCTSFIHIYLEHSVVKYLMHAMLNTPPLTNLNFGCQSSTTNRRWMLESVYCI